jgi:hypothetical protein
MGRFKGVRQRAKARPDGPIELYDLARDPTETTNIAGEHPDVVARMAAIMAGRTPSPIAEWNY